MAALTARGAFVWWGRAGGVGLTHLVMAQNGHRTVTMCPDDPRYVKGWIPAPAAPRCASCSARWLSEPSDVRYLSGTY